MLEKNDWAAAGVQTAARTPAAHAAPARKRASIARPRMIECQMSGSIPSGGGLGVYRPKDGWSTLAPLTHADCGAVLPKSRAPIPCDGIRRPGAGKSYHSRVARRFQRAWLPDRVCDTHAGESKLSRHVSRNSQREPLWVPLTASPSS